MSKNNTAWMTIQGIGNHGTGRTAYLGINDVGRIACVVGCYKGNLRGLKDRIRRNYGKDSCYLKIIEAAAAELRRQHKSPRFGRQDVQQPMPEHLTDAFKWVW